MAITFSLKNYYHVRCYRFEREISNQDVFRSDILMKLFYAFPISYISYNKQNERIFMDIKKGNISLYIFFIAFTVGAVSGYLQF